MDIGSVISIFELKEVLKTAHDELSMAVSVLLESETQEIFGIIENNNPLIEHVDRTSNSSAVLGLHGVNYYLAGVAVNIATITIPVTRGLEKKRVSKAKGATKEYKPTLRKLIKYQGLMTDFSDDVLKKCHSPLFHIASQIMVLLEHPAIEQDAYMHSHLANQLELVEELSERIYAVADRFKNHRLLKIDAGLIPDGLVH